MTETISSISPDENSNELRVIVDNAIGYWEPRRVIYNAILVAVVVTWITFAWPHFRLAFTWGMVVALLVLAMLANLCYSAAYVADVPFQYSSFQRRWLRWRWCLWLTGMLFAAVLANFWIFDQIYSYVPHPH